MKKLISILLVILCIVLSLPVYATEYAALDISIVDNACSGLNAGSSYDPETRTLILSEGEYGKITCDNDLTIKTSGTACVYEINADKNFGSSTLKIENAVIKPRADKVGSRIICDGDIEITKSTVEVDYFIGTNDGGISIDTSTVTAIGIDKTQGYLFASGNISIRKSTVSSDYNINTYGSMVIEDSNVILPSKYSNGGYITAPYGILIKNSNLDVFYYISCDSGDFRAVNSKIEISLKRDDNKRRSNIEVGLGNIIIAECDIAVDAYIKSNLGNIKISDTTIDTGSIVSWQGTVTLNKVQGNINGAASINSPSKTGIFGKTIELIKTELPEAHKIGNVVLGETQYETITLENGEMTYGFKLFATKDFPVLLVIILSAAAVIIAVVVIIVVVKKKKKTKVSE